LSLQAQELKDPQVLKIFKESADRIRAMAMIHEKLYGATNFSSIQFSEYVKTLANDLVSSYALRPDKIKLEISSNEVILDITQAVPLGLIVNELLSNACKYAFPDGQPGHIFVELQTGEIMEMKISDDGVGLPADFDAHSPRTLGYRLVKLLVKQLQGTIEVASANPGTYVRMTFPMQI
jgi:two-component sensor histidine kinase